MSLPTVESARFELQLPSNGSTIYYRPYVVKEQKLILQAREMQDIKLLNTAIEDVIKACTFGDFDISTAPVYDVEYVLLRIRAKSAGEIVDMMYACRGRKDDGSLCNMKLPVKVNLMGVNVVKPEEHEHKIMITDSVGIIMRDLPYDIYKASNGEDLAEVGMEVVCHCIDKIFDADNVHSRKDFTDDELTEFLESLPTKTFEKIEKFVDTMPRLEQVMTLRCPHCSNEDTTILRGLDSFLM